MENKNYVIYHRNNRMLELTNHFELDGELDANYVVARNLALTGNIFNGKFISKYPNKFHQVIECAKTKHNGSRCNLCSGIFKDVMNNDYSITEFYRNKVVKIDLKTALPHPLTEFIKKKFKGVEID